MLKEPLADSDRRWQLLNVNGRWQKYR